jgi:hypothetical protein
LPDVVPASPFEGGVAVVGVLQFQEGPGITDPREVGLPPSPEPDLQLGELEVEVRIVDLVEVEAAALDAGAAIQGNAPEGD